MKREGGDRTSSLIGRIDNLEWIKSDFDVDIWQCRYLNRWSMEEWYFAERKEPLSGTPPGLPY